eukprot:350981-Chlamydomonas_euryale.AAC.4
MPPPTPVLARTLRSCCMRSSAVASCPWVCARDASSCWMRATSSSRGSRASKRARTSSYAASRSAYLRMQMWQYGAWRGSIVSTNSERVDNGGDGNNTKKKCATK